MEEKKLSVKESRRRNRILSGNLWSVIPYITAPLAVYALFNYLYGFFDLVVVSYIGKNEVASIVFIEEIKNAVTAFGVGIALGGTVLVARHYGAGKMDEARKYAANSFSLALIVALIVVLLSVSFGTQLLKLLNAPDVVIESGIGYFNIQMVTTAVVALNSVFIGLEKAKGNTMMILILNIVTMLVKLGLTAWFVFGMDKGTVHVALATLIAQASMLVVGLVVMFGKNNSLRIRLSDLGLLKAYVMPILAISIPVFSGKFLFSIGKVFVNSMAAFYGPLAVAALGIAMKLGGGAGQLAQVFEESETSVISQNLGNGSLKRSFRTYWISQFYSVIVALAGMLLIVENLERIIPLFTNVDDVEYMTMLKEIFKWEKYSILTSSSISIITGMFIGFKLAKVAFFLNIIRLFVFRIPTLIIMLKAGIDYHALGYVMFISNSMTLVVAAVLMVVFYLRSRSYGYKDLLFH